jgi:hypothetical protein
MADKTDLTIFIGIDSDGNWSVGKDKEDATYDTDSDLATVVYSLTLTVNLPLESLPLSVDLTGVQPGDEPVRALVRSTVETPE